jgi:ribosomal protein S13
MTATATVHEAEVDTLPTVDTMTTQHLKPRLTIVHHQAQVHRDAATTLHQTEAKNQKVKEATGTRHRRRVPMSMTGKWFDTWM